MEDEQHRKVASVGFKKYMQIVHKIHFSGSGSESQLLLILCKMYKIQES